MVLMFAHSSQNFKYRIYTTFRAVFTYEGQTSVLKLAETGGKFWFISPLKILSLKDAYFLSSKVDNNCKIN